MQVCKQFNCCTISYCLAVREDVNTSSTNAFSVLMASQRERHLPSKLGGDAPRSDQRLRNDLLGMLAAMNVGWSPDLVTTVGERCVKVLTSALWYIDPCHKQFHDRSISLPPIVDRFEGYNDWKAKKIKKPQLSMEGLNLHLEQLTSLLNQPWLFSPSFKQLRETIDALAEAFNTYRSYLKQQSNAYSVNQASLTPARTISESIELVPVEVVSQCSSQYADIQTALSTKPMYTPVFANDFAPEDRHQRKNWFAGLKLVSPSMMYRFMHGNNLGTLVFVWNVPKEGGEATANAKLVSELSSHQKVYSTREMRRLY